MKTQLLSLSLVLVLQAFVSSASAVEPKLRFSQNKSELVHAGSLRQIKGYNPMTIGGLSVLNPGTVNFTISSIRNPKVNEEAKASAKSCLKLSETVAKANLLRSAKEPNLPVIMVSKVTVKIDNTAAEVFKCSVVKIPKSRASKLTNAWYSPKGK